MLKRWAGPLIATLILIGVGLILVLNLDLSGGSRPPRTSSAANSPAPAVAVAPGAAKPAGFREYPIGDPVEQAKMRIAAVWLPAIQMDGMAGPQGAEIIHMEADIHATEGNPNGFAMDEFIPYMEVAYKIFSAKGGDPVQQGKFMPMVAGDGPHYGASIEAPAPGEYRLEFDLKPPSAGGLGRHSDPATGVAPWWEPFAVSFDWDFEGVPKPEAAEPAKS